MGRDLLSKQYPKATALYIMDLVNRLLVDAKSGGIDFLEFRDDAENSPGVYVSKLLDGMFPQGEAGLEAGNMLAWKPACDMENGPHARTAPSLPETFTAAELAAFMLYGPGDAIQELLGPIGSLDETALLKIGGKQGEWEREALGAAYEAARQAQDVVGAPDFEADDYVSRDAWIKAMVRQLLEPSLATSEQPAEIEPQAQHQSAPAEAPHSTRTKLDNGVSKAEILAVFPELKGQTAEQWERMLGDPPKWLKVARIDRGGRSIQSRWNPAQLAMCIDRRGDMQRRQLGAIIRRSFPEYLDEWEDYAGSFDRPAGIR